MAKMRIGRLNKWFEVWAISRSRPTDLGRRNNVSSQRFLREATGVFNSAAEHLLAFRVVAR